MSHLDPYALIRAIDGELGLAEEVALEEHLTICGECRLLQRELGALSIRLEQAVSRIPVTLALDDRALIERRLRESSAAAGRRNPATRWTFLRWPVAAAVVAAAIIVPAALRHAAGPSPAATATSGPATFELEGETFVALPYSNPALPVNSAHIVQMEVPVSSLAEAGVVSGPVAPDAADTAVLADVLMGEDGEPRGVHLLSE